MGLIGFKPTTLNPLQASALKCSEFAGVLGRFSVYGVLSGSGFGSAGLQKLRALSPSKDSVNRKGKRLLAQLLRKVWELGFRVLGFRFRVWGLGVRARVSGLYGLVRAWMGPCCTAAKGTRSQEENSLV